jgi:cysteine desulfurase
MSEFIYFDNSATTKISDEALSTYNDISQNFFANPSSLHSLGFSAEEKIKSARQTILNTLRAQNSEIVFCASGSEANNLAIMGRAFAKERYRKGAKIITTMGEHASVSEPFVRLSKMGFEVAYIKTFGGKIDTEQLIRELTPNVILVSFMMVNNETGALYDVKSAASIIKSKCPEALFHIDCTQSYLKLPFTKAQTGADMLTLSSHKIEGPKGVGALIIEKSVIKCRGLSPLILGGGQEGGLRSGTENVAGICAFARAAQVGYENLTARYEKMRTLRDYLIEKLDTCTEFRDIYLTKPPFSAPHILNITVPNIKSETLLHFLSSKGIFVSSGSACSSNSTHKAGALTAFGHSEAMADSSIRISFSHRNETSEIEVFLDALREASKSLARIRR